MSARAMLTRHRRAPLSSGAASPRGLCGRARVVCVRAGRLAPEEIRVGHTAWFDKHKQLWVELADRQALDAAVAALPEGKSLMVDYYAGWCAVCKSAYTSLCKMAVNPEYTDAFVFAKATIEQPEIKAIIKGEGISGIPWVSVYTKGLDGTTTKLAGFGASTKRMQALKANLQHLASNRHLPPPREPYSLDPNGFLLIDGQPSGAPSSPLLTSSAASQ